VDDQVRAAISASHLRGLPTELTRDLLVEAQRVRVPAGQALHRAGDQEPHVELVLLGLVRVYASAPDGRTLTVRYCRTGALMGVLSLYTEAFVMPATTQAITDAELLAIRPAVVKRLADRDVRMARALLLELSERASMFASEIGFSAFSNVRQRVARHLLDLSAERQRDGMLVARISQQDLAEAVGTVREVVVRTLRELRHDHLVETGRAGIVVTDPERLLAEAQPDWPSRWNTSR
jgi:CRP/FNR family transcriptional regulator, cyclic AMP receptor protein